MDHALYQAQMNLFELVKAAPPDPILGLSEAFRADPNPEKINLTVGVYQDAEGKPPVLPSVLEAQKRLAEEGAGKSYLPINGDPLFLQKTRALVFGPQSHLVEDGRVASVQTPGGTAALRLAGDFIQHGLGQRTVWLSNPTWANHKGIFTASGLEIASYPYYNAETHDLNLEGMITVLEAIPDNDVVVFHACCHNPTGVDPSIDNWDTIAKVCKERRLLPILDFAYQGFSRGILDDAAAVRAFAEYGLEFFVCTSFSKNFSLYQDRVGVLHVVAKNSDEAERSLSRLKALVRTNYSNPPAHGSAIIRTILSDSELRQQWEEELKEMRLRLKKVRGQLVDALAEAAVPGDFGFLRNHRGMFSYTGLPEATLQRLRAEYSIYIVESGRINVAGLNEANLPRFARALADCL